MGKLSGRIYAENVLGRQSHSQKKNGHPGRILDLLPDRQSFEQLDGSQRSRDEFVTWINTEVLPELRRFAGENKFRVWEDLTTIKSDDGFFVCQATPKNSGGEYLYIGCWEIE